MKFNNIYVNLIEIFLIESIKTVVTYDNKIKCLLAVYKKIAHVFLMLYKCSCLKKQYIIENGYIIMLRVLNFV